MKKIKLILCLALITVWGTMFSQTVVITDDPAYTLVKHRQCWI